MKTAADYVGQQSGREGRVWVEYRGDVAILWMDRGENRMNDHFIDSINGALDEIESKSNVKALITTSVGKFYSNGLDLEWLGLIGGHVPEHLEVFLSNFKKLQMRILVFPMLTIAALNGHTFAGGALFSLIHDYRVMSTERGWWCLNEVFLRMRFQPWMMRLINCKLTSARAGTELVLLGKRCTAVQAKELGVVDVTALASGLLGAALSLAARVLPPNDGIDRQSLSDMKHDLHRDIIALLDTPHPAYSFTSAAKL